MLFRDKFNTCYYLRTTTKANYRYLIWRGNNERLTPVICFLTKEVEKLRTISVKKFGDKKDIYTNQEKYLFDEDDIAHIRTLPQNNELQIIETITIFEER